MLNYSNTGTASAGDTNYGSHPYFMNPQRTYALGWVATARQGSDGQGHSDVIQSATRTATTCYMRGLKELINFTATDGTPWEWRRICFTWKSQATLNYGINAGSYLFYTNNTGSGYQRVINDLSGSQALANIAGALFRGAQGVDWNNFLDAPLDNSNVSVKYDRRRVIRSGNSAGALVDFTMWFPMNKNLVYADDEFGSDENLYAGSTEGKQGMGDYYVMDFISSGVPISTTASQLSMAINSRLYWHEK